MTGFNAFTPHEQQVWDGLAQVAGAVLALVQAESAHPMEAAEIATAFHDIQARLLARPAMRAMTAAQQPKVVYLVTCHDCTGDPIPFMDMGERATWVLRHTSETGHTNQTFAEEPA